MKKTKSTLNKKTLLNIAFAFLFSTSAFSQTPIIFRDHFSGVWPATIVTSVDVYLDPVTQPWYDNNSFAPYPLLDGEVEYYFEMHIPAPPSVTWLAGRKLGCIENINPLSLDENLCVSSHCYGVLPNGASDYNCMPYTYNTINGVDYYRLKPKIMDLDLNTTSFVEFIYYCESGTVEGNNWVKDNDYYGEVPLRIHINGGNCSTTASINDIEKNAITMSISPNPSIDSKITITLDDASLSNQYSYSIQSLSGQSVLTGESTESTFDIQLNELGAGLYYLNMMSTKTGAMVVRQFVVQ